MKNGLLSILLVFSAWTAQAQSKRVLLEIHHRVGNDTCTTTAIGTNGTQLYQLSRIQYYLDRFVLLHDGAAADTSNVVALVDGLAPKRIDLGTFTFDSLSSLRFAVGVNPSLNHLDPTTYNANHPLAPKSPSMHWCWASGYRFIAVEGFSGQTPSGGQTPTLNQMFQFHGLGDDNFAMLTLPVQGQYLAADTVLITLEANYDHLFTGLYLPSGPISHGETGDAKVVLRNINSGGVFSSSEGVAVGLEEHIVRVPVHPNPAANGQFQLELPQPASFQLFDHTGRTLQHGSWQAGTQRLKVDATGVYYLQIRLSNGAVSNEKLFYVER